MKYLRLWMFTFVVFAGRFQSFQDEDFEESDVQDVFEALQASLDFFNLSLKDKSTLDVSFLLAATSGQLQGLLDYLHNSTVVVNEKISMINNQIKEVIQEMEAILEESLESSRKLFMDDSIKFAELVTPKLWTFYSPSKTTNQSLLVPLIDDDSFAEYYSDDCLSSLFGTGEYSIRCTITTTCWDMVSAYNFNNYSLTHQLLYLIVAQRLQCWNKLETLSNENKQPSPSEQVEIKCANILNESKEIAMDNFPLRHGDIFLQQSFFCGLLGYKDFYSSGWLQVILNWQRRSGCFSYSKSRNDPQKLQTNQIIDKRMDMTLEYGCSSHFTSLAVATFGQYIRYIVDEEVLRNGSKRVIKL